MLLIQRTFNSAVVLFTVVIVLSAAYGNSTDFSSTICVTPRLEAGTCVVISQCPELEMLLRKPGRRTEDYLYLRQSACSLKGTTPTLCCPLNGLRVVEQPSAIQQRTSVNSNSNSTTDTPVQNEVHEMLVDVSTSPRLKKLLPLTRCGPVIEFKVINGMKATVGQFPWMALLGYETLSPEIEFFCGGTLINDRYVLTAAHCVTELPPHETLKLVRLGELNIDNETDCTGQGVNQICAPPIEKYSIEEIIPHPNYSKPTKFLNDIALIRLNQTIQFKDHIVPICLPTGNEQTRNFLQNDSKSKLFVAGWGTTQNRTRSRHLLYGPLPVQQHQDCVQSYSESKIPISSSRQMCAGGNATVDSCSGDSGGPLKGLGEVDGSQQFVQYGIVSFGPDECSTKNLPAVYTRVGFYMDWILDSLKE